MGKGEKGQKRKQAKEITKVEAPNPLQFAPKLKQRVLVFCSRGCTARYRHLLNDVRELIPHSKKDVKLDSKDHLPVINEICEMKNCNNCIYFEVRKRKDLFMWISKPPTGPSAKLLVVNVHTMDELKLTGNCLKGSRPLLSFDSNFDTIPHLQLLKEMFTHSFATPNRHPKSKPFIDHIISFSFVDDRIWFRHFQITWPDNNTEAELNEIGPRFVMQVVRIFNDSFKGETLYENPNYVSPNVLRAEAKKKAGSSFVSRTQEKRSTVTRKVDSNLEDDEVDDIFKAQV